MIDRRHLKSFRRPKFLFAALALLGSVVLIIALLSTTLRKESQLDARIRVLLNGVTTPDQLDPNTQPSGELGESAVSYLARTAVWKAGLREELGEVVWRYAILRPLRSRFADQETIRQIKQNQRAAVIALGTMGATAQGALP